MLVFAMVAHEYAHAVVALQQGDDTAYVLGRVTLNPLPHIDPFMSLLLPALLWFASSGQFTFGGAKPVPVNSRKFRHYTRGDILVSAAGVTTNFLLALVWAFVFILLGLLARSLPDMGPMLATAQRMMVPGIWLNLLLCFFNLIPIPPLDGSHVFKYLLPIPLAIRYQQVARYGIIVLIALMWFSPRTLSVIMSPAYRTFGWTTSQLRGYTLPTMSQWLQR
jgi:Zn-dependent protease